MTCPSCTAFNDADARYCQQCSQPLHEEASILAGETAPARKRVSDTGYLLIALSALALNGFSWMYDKLQQGRPVAERIGTESPLRIASFVYPLVLFGILFLYSKRPLYRVLIALSALLIFYLSVRRILHY
ncbi:MAG: zinc ribbon domain-containing protein [Chitinophagaceae bacterium]|nr:MAG: zinc ribbon domain-containing protein [Chitinophagaceae bacterium]